MSGLPRRFSDWIVSHPVLWAAGLGVALIVIGVSLAAPPLLVLVAGAVLGLVNLLHARRRGYCPVPEVDGPVEQE